MKSRHVQATTPDESGGPDQPRLKFLLCITPETSTPGRCGALGRFQFAPARRSARLKGVINMIDTIAVPQSYVGRVNVVGDCYCLGVVVDRRPPTYKNIPVYISVAGPATSVEALWAKLSPGKETGVVPDDRSKTTIY